MTKAVAAKRQSRRSTMTAMARISSIAVGPRLKATLRIRKSVERAPRSMTRASAPVCLLWWKSSDRPRAWAKVSTAARARVACDTAVNTASLA